KVIVLFIPHYNISILDITAKFAVYVHIFLALKPAWAKDPSRFRTGSSYAQFYQRHFISQK
ncbi:MAG TPA: hypothetical protein VJK54_01930, partial [Chthoniobacterales bacterium]|nr:hypothetical protein [Chthoniobacterales bacterium]